MDGPNRGKRSLGLSLEKPEARRVLEELIKTSDEVAQAIADGKGVVVVHGVDHNGDGVYSGDVPSDLDPSLPTEATDPALCGVLEQQHDDGDDHGHDDMDEHEH